jgi:hypothetical protein
MTAWFADYHPNSNMAMSAGLRSARFDLAPVMAFCLTFALVLFLPQILNDSDTLWQIRTGEWVLTHHAIPTIDPFSYTAGDRPWFAHEWLAETLMALAYRAGGTQNGMAGIMVLAAFASGLTAALLLHHLRRFLPGIYAVLGLIVALSNAAPSMLARPHLLAWPCLVAWCGGLVTARANRTAPSVALLPVMLIWVNLHGSFMIGLLLAGTFLIEACSIVVSTIAGYSLPGPRSSSPPGQSHCLTRMASRGSCFRSTCCTCRVSPGSASGSQPISAASNRWK